MLFYIKIAELNLLDMEILKVYALRLLQVFLCQTYLIGVVYIVGYFRIGTYDCPAPDFQELIKTPFYPLDGQSANYQQEYKTKAQ